MRRSFGGIAAAAALLLLAPATLLAHGLLRRAVPAEGARLTSAPRELRLTFNERVELAVSRLTLVGARGDTIALGAARLEGGTTLVASVAGGLRAGAHVIHWQTVGRDGHPVRGTVRFTIAAGAAGLAPDDSLPDTVPTIAPATLPPGEPSGAIAAPGADTPPAEHHAAAVGGFDAESWQYVVVRWLQYVGLLLVIGASAFRFAVMRSVAHEGDAGFVADASRRAAGIGLAAAALVALAVVLRVVAQSYAMHGERAFDAALVGTMIGATLWGWSWLLQGAAALLAIVGFAIARRGRPLGWPLAGLAALLLAVTPALAGHAAASSLAGVTVTADVLHVLAAAGWLGALALIVLAGLPGALALGAERRGPAAASLVNAFSPYALLFAGTVVATGVVSGWAHLRSLDALFGSAYGRVLLVKLLLLVPVLFTGFYNWRRVRPALGTEPAAHRVRRSSAIELAVSLLVLAATAVLVATPIPEG